MDLNQPANTATNVSISSGVVTTGMTAAERYTDWVTSNAVLIGVTCTVISLLVALIFHILNYRNNVKNAQANNTRNHIQMMQQVEKWKSEGKSDEEIESILKLSGLK